MIDDKKIEEVSKKFRQDFHENGDRTQGFLVQFGFEAGAKWAINEFLKNLWHAACEVPWNDKGKVLSFSREIGYRKLYDMNAMLDKTTCNTYKEMWEKEVKAYRWSDWIYVDELFGLITKGGKQ